MPKILEKDPCDTSGDLQTDTASCGFETDGDKSVAMIEEASPGADSPEMRKHHLTCKTLLVDADLVSSEDLWYATLTNDEIRQFTLLARLYNACGIGEKCWEADRSHIVKTIAADRPETEAERDALYTAQIAQSLISRSAKCAHYEEKMTAVHVRNTLDLEDMKVRARQQFEALRTTRMSRRLNGVSMSGRVKGIGHTK